MNYFYDKNNVRYTLASTQGGKPLNWLFIPGGPGLDSSYLYSLTKLLQLSGNTWLIDFPGNGSHAVKKEGFDEWLSLFIPTVQQFQNPVIVGQSFGGMLPLLFNELENLLSGLIILNSSPCLWLEAAVQFAKDHHLPDLSKEMQSFTENPNQATFDAALEACMPYYFPPKSLSTGRELLKEIAFTFEPAVWWQRKAVEISYNAAWIPEKVKTLIIGGEFDAITPFSLFQQDKRFDKHNIQKALIKNAGHLPWVEEPEVVKALVKAFERTL